MATYLTKTSLQKFSSLENPEQVQSQYLRENIGNILCNESIPRVDLCSILFENLLVYLRVEFTMEFSQELRSNIQDTVKCLT